MIISAVITYDDDSQASFSGSPLDLSTIPTFSSAEQVSGDQEPAQPAEPVEVQAEEPLPADDSIPGVA